MSKFNSSKVMPRYFVIAIVLTLIGFAIVGFGVGCYVVIRFEE